MHTLAHSLSHTNTHINMQWAKNYDTRECHKEKRLQSVRRCTVEQSTGPRSDISFTLYVITLNFQWMFVRKINNEILRSWSSVRKHLNGNGQYWRPLCSHSNYISQTKLQLSVFPYPTVEIVETIPANNPLWNVGLKTNNDPTKLDSKLR
jgi:hypothetical protein